MSQSTSSVPSCFCNSAPSQSTPSSEGTNPRSSTATQSFTSFRGTACAFSTPNSLRRRSQLWWCASYPIKTGTCASCTATRDSQVKPCMYRLWRDTELYVLAFGGLEIIGAWLSSNILPCMFLLSPPNPPLVSLSSLPAAEDPRLLPTDLLSYVLQSPPCLTRNTHTVTNTFLYVYTFIFLQS